MKFGDKVKVTSILSRTCEYRQRKMYSGREKPQPYKFWKETKIKPRDAILIGFRTLRNGFKYWESECGWIFESEESFKAALVVFNEKEIPRLTLLSAIK
jgi:hypothetical protein